MNKHINEGLKWKYLAGLINESEYLDSITQIGSTPIAENNNDVDDFDDDEDYVDLDLDDSFAYQYSTFQQFIDSKFGSELSTEEKVKAIEEWATGYNIGENPGDFAGLTTFITPEIMEALKSSNISQIFIDELLREMNPNNNSTELGA